MLSVAVKRVAIAAILDLLSPLDFTHKSNAVDNLLRIMHLARANRTYLSFSYSKTHTKFEAMSLLKAGLVVDCVDTAWKTLLAGLALRYLLWVTAMLDFYVLGVAPSITEVDEGFEFSQQDLFPDKFENDVILLQDLPYRIERVANYSKDRARDYVVWTVMLIVGYLFDCTIFLFILIFFTLMRGIVRSIFRGSLRNSSMDFIGI